MGMEALRKAIEIAGSQAELARRIGKRQGHVWAWLNRDGRVPAEVCRLIEQATGVPRHELRPDIFDAPETAREGAA